MSQLFNEKQARQIDISDIRRENKLGKYKSRLYLTRKKFHKQLGKIDEPTRL